MLPVAASETAREVDSALLIITGISVGLLVAITAVMVYFVIRYRRSSAKKTKQIRGHAALEIAWTVIPTLIVIGMFFVGYEGFVTFSKLRPVFYQANFTLMKYLAPPYGRFATRVYDFMVKSKS